jgi:hypothetical protein
MLFNSNSSVESHLDQNIKLRLVIDRSTEVFE